MTLGAGDTVLGYELLRILGAGGFATVWLAEDRNTGSRVALKVLHPAHLNEKPARRTARRRNPSVGPSVADRFVEEAQLLRTLSSPGLVKVLDVIDQRPGGALAIVLERLHGEDLSSASESLTLDQILSVFAQISDTLGYLHQQNVIHRDVKRANIFVCAADAQGRRAAKLLDLGVAKDLIARAARQSTATGELIGSLENMAPEVLRESRGEQVEVSFATDQWGLGISLYASLLGKPPYTGAPWSLMKQIATAPAPQVVLPERFGRSTPIELQEIIERCLAKSPSDRFSSMLELSMKLRLLQSQVTGRQVGRIPTAATDANLDHDPTEPVAPPWLRKRPRRLATEETEPMQFSAKDREALKAARKDYEAPDETLRED